MSDKYISADKLYKLLRYSKRKTKYLLDNGIIPCEVSDKTTWRYRIKKADVEIYIENFRNGTTSYFIPVGIFSSKGPQDQNLQINLSDEEYERLYGIIKRGLSKMPDALTVNEAVAASGYSRTFIINCIQSGALYAEQINRRFIIPKDKLVCFLADRSRLAVTYKSEFHKKMLRVLTEKLQ